LKKLKGLTQNLWEKWKSQILLCEFLVLLLVIILLFGDYIQAHSDTLMVIITSVYVVATVYICRSNIKTAEATREQVLQSSAQFKEHRRMELLPFLQIEFLTPQPIMRDPDISLNLTNAEFSSASLIDRTIYVKNIGLGTAMDISYVWRTIDLPTVRGQLTETALRPGESCGTLADFCIEHKENCEDQFVIASLDFEYKDLLNNQYCRHVDLRFHLVGENDIYFDGFKTTQPIRIEHTEKENPYV